MSLVNLRLRDCRAAEQRQFRQAATIRSWPDPSPSFVHMLR